MATTGLVQGSAQIYQFPVGGRAALGGRRYGEAASATNPAPSEVKIDWSDNWYHQAAIDETKPARDH